MPQDKNKGVKQTGYSPSGNIDFVKTIDTSGYSAGAKKFHKVTEYSRGGVKQSTAKRKEVDRVIKNPKTISFGPEGSTGYSRSDMNKLKTKLGIGRPDTPLANTPEPKPVQ